MSESHEGPSAHDRADESLPPAPAPPDEPYFVEIKETLVGRTAGGGAEEKARELRAADRLGTFAARILGGRTDERAWRKGAHGEAFVGWLFRQLPEGWYVFNDIPVGDRGANIDHLVIGPGGVFTVNTKNLSGKVWLAPRMLLVSGHRTDHLPQATREAQRASRLLTGALGRPVEVRPVLAIIAPDWNIKEKPTDVHVGSPRGVKKWILGQPAMLSSQDVINIAGVAAKPSTWAREAHKAPRRGPIGTETQKVPRRPDIDPGDPCPCGGQVVVRKRKADGSRFLGCSRFPKCRRTWPLRD